MSSSGSAAGALSAELAEYHRQVREILADVEKLLEGISDSRLNWRPSPEKWSIAQCLDHLNSGWGALPKLDRAIAGAGERGIRGAGPYRHPLLGKVYLRFTEPPPKIRVSAPRRFRPVAERSISDVVPRFLGLQQEILARIESADGLDLGRIRLSSPISRRFRMSLGQWFAFLAAHERRHLWQAWQVRRHLEFPAGDSR
ncbi:MAG TPA: DinB family protein [Thermoanaerobaculia bacterium]|nr:DinB family protein [Thermoanaerobaculia bacterium]